MPQLGEGPAKASFRPGSNICGAQPHGDVIHGSCSYWEPLYYLLNTILGWRDLGRGLAWWYTNGRPVQDPRLGLMQAIWDSDGQLAYFAAWAFQEGRDTRGVGYVEWLDAIRDSGQLLRVGRITNW